MSDYRHYFAGKRITLIGLGLLGRGVGDAEFLARCGAELTVTDLKSEAELAPSLKKLEGFKNIRYVLGEHKLEDFRARDMILKAAGIPLDSIYIAEARKNNIPVRMSADLFAELSGAVVVGITGTRGKSTVTHMIAHILKTAGKQVLLGGNVRGVSTLSLLPDVTPETMAVLELDSWQLQGFGDAHMSPHVSVFTTFFPDHMNYYKNDMEAYFKDKAQIFLNQTPEDTFVVGEQVAPYLQDYGYKNKIRAHTVVIKNNSLPEKIHLQIPGNHNRTNAALAHAGALALGIDEHEIEEALESFKAVEGRLQFVREVRGVKIYNDTNATTPEATIVALDALHEEGRKNIVLIMGGSEKNLDMEQMLTDAKKYSKKILLLAGKGTDRIKEQLPGVDVYNSMAEAVTDAFSAAEPGDVMLMSPGFASFGIFKNEYDRSDQFNAAIADLQ